MGTRPFVSTTLKRCAAAITAGLLTVGVVTSVAGPAGATPKQACEAVLRCLNGNACESNYCNAGNIRSGWRLEEAKPSKPPR